MPTHQATLLGVRMIGTSSQKPSTRSECPLLENNASTPSELQLLTTRPRPAPHSHPHPYPSLRSRTRSPASRAPPSSPPAPQEWVKRELSHSKLERSEF